MKQARNAIISKKEMRVLVTTPHLYLSGGVANYYNTIAKHFSVKAEFFELGALKVKEDAFQKARHMVSDWLGFRNRIKKNLKSYDLIHVNPSFVCGALVRDGVLVRIAKSMNQKTLVFFHGWNDKYTKIVEKYFFSLFFSTFNKADAFIVLASEFENKIRDWGFKQPIYIATTPVDNELLKGYSIQDRIRRIQGQKAKKILFLSRIEKEKGILETIQACQILCTKYQDLRLIIAGDGSYMETARQFIKTVGMSDRVSFLGYVKGEGKIKAFLESDIYVFPSYHAEGMPTSVLEAMAFGLPVVTRPVGGLKDFFVDGQHGFMNESKDPVVIASLVQRIIQDRDLHKRMSISCHNYAKDKFMASKVAKTIESIYGTIVRQKVDSRLYCTGRK